MMESFLGTLTIEHLYREPVRGKTETKLALTL